MRRLTDVEKATIRIHANMVQDCLDRALQMDTEQRRKDFEWAKNQFKERWPSHDWRSYADSKKEIQR